MYMYSTFSLACTFREEASKQTRLCCGLFILLIFCICLVIAIVIFMKCTSGEVLHVFAVTLFLVSASVVYAVCGTVTAMRGMQLRVSDETVSPDTTAFSEQNAHPLSRIKSSQRDSCDYPATTIRIEGPEYPPTPSAPPPAPVEANTDANHP